MAGLKGSACLRYFGYSFIVLTDYQQKCKLILSMWKLAGKVFQMVVEMLMLIIFWSLKNMNFIKRRELVFGAGSSRTYFRSQRIIYEVSNIAVLVICWPGFAGVLLRILMGINLGFKRGNLSEQDFQNFSPLSFDYFQLCFRLLTF